MRDAGMPGVAPVLLVGAGTVVALAALRGRNAAPDTADDATTAGSSGSSSSGSSPAVRDLWVWPLPRWHSYDPTCSDGFDSWRTNTEGQRIKHGGVDIMYRRKNVADQRDQYPPRTKYGSRDFFIPGDAVPVLAARDGEVWSAGKTKRGWAVVLDHGPPWASFYQHLSTIFVRETQRGRGHQRVRAGDVIGHVGADPLDGEGLMHVHFELWYRGGHEAAINPAPLMKTWLIAPIAPVTEPQPFIASV